MADFDNLIDKASKIKLTAVNLMQNIRYHIAVKDKTAIVASMHAM